MERKINKKILRERMLHELKENVKTDDEAQTYVIITCLVLQNKATEEIHGNVGIQNGINILCLEMQNFFNQNKDLLYKKRDEFDLCLEARGCADTLIKSCEITDEKQIEAVYEVIECAFVAKLKLWLEKWTRAQIIKYVEEGNIPLDLTNPSLMYEWGVKQGFSCSDLRSLRMIANEYQIVTAEDEKKSYEVMGKLCNLFDEIKDGAPKAMKELKEDFIDNNLLVCRRLFMATCAVIAITPNSERKNLQMMWDMYKSHFMDKEIEGKDEFFLNQIRNVFVYCVAMLDVLRERHGLDFCSHDKFFADVISMNAKKYK